AKQQLLCSPLRSRTLKGKARKRPAHNRTRVEWAEQAVDIAAHALALFRTGQTWPDTLLHLIPPSGPGGDLLQGELLSAPRLLHTLPPARFPVTLATSRRSPQL